jgi:hypothetical protein
MNEMFRAAAVVGIALALALAAGIGVALTDKTGHWVLLLSGVLAVGATAFVAGRCAGGPWAMYLGATVGFGSPLAALFGNYFAYHAQIGGLESRDFGSPDTPGEFYVLVSVFLLSPALVAASALTAFLAHLGSRRTQLSPR